MKTLRWVWFIIFLIFYSIPRVIYVVKFRLSEEPECKSGYDKYANLAKDAEAINTMKWWQI